MANTNISKKYKGEEGKRLDVFLSEEYSTHPRNFIQKQILNNQILVNGNPKDKSYKLKAGDIVTGEFIVAQTGLITEHADLDIIFENDDVIILNKPAGLVVHPGSGNLSGTLVNYLLGYNKNIINAVNDPSDEYESIRPGIVHRLDKDTTGIIVVAKNKKALASISKQMKNRKTKKCYLALCAGWPKLEKGTLTNYLGRSLKNRKIMADLGLGVGKEAISKYKVLKQLKDKQGNKISFLEFNIKTGRTHQIRIQSKIFGHPVLGDLIYTNNTSNLISRVNNIPRQMLHATSIDFFLPGETKISHFEAPLPDDFTNTLKRFSSEVANP